MKKMREEKNGEKRKMERKNININKYDPADTLLLQS